MQRVLNALLRARLSRGMIRLLAHPLPPLPWVGKEPKKALSSISHTILSDLIQPLPAQHCLTDAVNRRKKDEHGDMVSLQ
jgi:hypothetical protein